MKRLIALFLALVLIAGCATRPGESSVARFLPLVESAAYTGSVLYLTQHPEQRSAFIAADGALVALAGRDAIAFSDLQTAFRPLLKRSVKELRDPQTRLIIDNAVILVDAYAGRLDTSSASVAQLKEIALAAHRGLDRALAGAP